VSDTASVQPPPGRPRLAVVAPREDWGPLLDAMLHAVWLVEGADLTIAMANGAALDLWGGECGGLVGRSVLDLSPTPEDEAFWREARGGLVSGIARTGLVRAIESEALVRRADGAVVPVTRCVTRIGAEDGATFFVVALEDRAAAERRERALELRAAELEATLDSLADGVLVVDLRGALRHFNRRFADLWELPDELALRSADDDAVFDLMRTSVIDAAGYMRRLAAIEDAPLMRVRDVVRLHSGRILERTAVPQFSRGRPIGRMYTFREIEPPVRLARPHPAAR
jgi:PAS domain-containing protein